MGELRRSEGRWHKMFIRFRSLLAAAACTLLPVLSIAANTSDAALYEAEVAFLADLKSRVTGSPNHNKLIDHLQSELELLGLTVHTDTLNFTYMDQPLTPPILKVGGQEVEISSYSPYSGKTNDTGVSGTLVDLIGPTLEPNWTQATGNIAVLNVTNSPTNWSSALALWPGQPPWYVETGLPTATADAKIANLTAAAKAG